MPAACVFTMASSKEIQREVKILLVIHSFATTSNNKNKCPQFARIKYKKNSTAAENEKEKEKKKAIKRREGGVRTRRRILVLPENLFSEAHLKHLFIKLQILRRFHQSIQLSLIQWHYKSCPPPCELTAVSSLLFSSLLFASPVPTPPLSNKPPHFFQDFTHKTHNYTFSFPFALSFSIQRVSNDMVAGTKGNCSTSILKRRRN